MKYFRHRRSAIAGVDVSVTRTGYTGDRGYEIWIPVDGALAVWDRLFEVGEAYGIHPRGIRALDVARVEAGLILIEAEYTSSRHAISPEQNYSPFELGFARLVDFGKAAEFTGRRALLAERAAGGPARRLVGLELDWAGDRGDVRQARPGRPHLAVRRPLAGARLQGGARRSGVRPRSPGARRSRRWSGSARSTRPTRSSARACSVEYSVEGERGKVGATVVPMPFLDLPRKRT